MFDVKRYQFLLEAVTPIHHGQETFGNVSTILRRKTRQPDGGWAMVPCISGDSMRHQLREAVAYAYLDAAGMLDVGHLTEAALRLLFSGGMVTGRGDASTIKLDVYRELVELIPSLGLLGGCANNRVIPGRLTVDDAVLVCRETEHIVPDWIKTSIPQLDSCRAHVELEQRVRMDPTLDPAKRNLLSAGEQQKTANRLTASEAAHDTDDAVGRQTDKSSMMPRQFERVASGSYFFWTVEATCLSDLDVDTFHTMVATFLANARVGGKRATGHGLMRAVRAMGITVNRPADRMHSVSSTELAPKMGELFRSHVKERSERVKKILAEVDA